MLLRSREISESSGLRNNLPGLALCASIACGATAAAMLAGSAVVWGLVFGLLAAAPWSPPATFQPGISFAAKQVMRIGVTLLGFQISLSTLQVLNISDVAALAIDVAVVLIAGWFLGPALGVRRELSLVAQRRSRSAAHRQRRRSHALSCAKIRRRGMLLVRSAPSASSLRRQC